MYTANYQTPILGMGGRIVGGSVHEVGQCPTSLVALPGPTVPGGPHSPDPLRANVFLFEDSNLYAR